MASFLSPFAEEVNSRPGTVPAVLEVVEGEVDAGGLFGPRVDLAGVA